MTPGGVEEKVRLHRTIRQALISHLQSRPVTAWLTLITARGDNPYFSSSRRRALRTARAAGEPD